MIISSIIFVFNRYENEEGCGKAIRDFMNETKTPRSEIFYTTKLMANNGFEHTRKAIKKSLELSGLDYIDLYLIHGPYPDRDGRLQAWKAIEEAIDQGIIKSAGVSNYAIRHLEELYETNPKYRPTVNQIDVHPFMTRAEEVEFNRQHNVLIEAWGPLARAMRFDNPTLASIAKTHNKSPAQVLLRWSIQNGFIPLPKSVKKERLISNSQVFDFDLSKDEMDKLSQLDECELNYLLEFRIKANICQ